MNTKKRYHLFIVLVVLLIHTLVLSFWLEDGEPAQKQANFKIESQPHETPSQTILNAKLKIQKDSIKNVERVFTTNFGSNIK